MSTAVEIFWGGHVSFLLMMEVASDGWTASIGGGGPSPLMWWSHSSFFGRDKFSQKHSFISITKF